MSADNRLIPCWLRKAGLGCLGAGLLATAFLCAKVAEPGVRVGSNYSFKEIEDFSESPLASVLGEFRVSISDFLWLKAEEYHHSGILFRKPTKRETDEGVEEMVHEPENEDPYGHHDHEIHHAHDDEEDHHGHDHGDGEHHGHHGVGVIPSPERDVRGVLGDLDRAVHPNPATDKVEHGPMREMIPLYRMLTLVNPHHVRAYVVGAYVVAAHMGKPQKAREFLEEGAKNNPESMAIQEALGRLHFFTLRDPDQGLPHFDQALQIGERIATLEAHEETGLRNAFRNKAILLWRIKKDYGGALAVLEAGLNRFPSDRAMPQLKASIREEMRKRSEGPA